MHKKNLICICAALLFSFVFPLSFFATGCGNGTKESVRDDKNLPVIVIGSDNYPPYNYEDANGKPTGIDVDLATEAFYRMGYRAVFTLIDWEAKNWSKAERSIASGAVSRSTAEKICINGHPPTCTADRSLR